MMGSSLLAAAAAPTRLDPLELFLMADIVVQAVMAGLLLASVWSWMIIIAFILKIGGARERIASVMESQVAEEADTLATRLTFLATLGSVAPFVGLFGTVWGIMNSFFQIGIQQNSSLAVVAPGIAEALFATAIGLFAAIPAVIAYNRFGASVNRYEALLQRFADRFSANLSRELERV